MVHFIEPEIINPEAREQFSKLNLRKENVDLFSFYLENGMLALSQLHKGSKTKIGILDTGVDLYNLWLETRNIKSFSIFELKENLDSYGHGTNMIGIMAAKKLGLLPNSEILMYNILNKNDVTHPLIMAEAIMRLIEQKVNIIFFPIQITITCKELEEACIAAKNNGILLISAASIFEEKYYPYEYCDIKSDKFAIQYKGSVITTDTRNSLTKIEDSECISAAIIAVYLSLVKELLNTNWAEVLSILSNHNFDLNKIIREKQNGKLL